MLPYTRPRAPLALRARPSASEVKSFDVQVAGGNIPLIAAAAGAEPGAAFTGITEINCIQQGATVAQRIGNKVVIKSIHLKCTLAATVLNNLSIARLALIYDKQPNGAFPNIADIFTEQPAGAVVFYGSLNIANKSRFSIIRDQFVTFDPAAQLVKTFNMYIKGRFEVEYGANAGNIGDFRTGAIYLVSCYQTNIVFLMPAACRCRYFD